MVIFPDHNELRHRMQLESRDARLLQLLFSSQVSADEKADFCASLKIEDEPMEFNLMLAHLCHRHGYLGIPVEIEPRIRGAARFYLFKNGALFSSFRALGRSLNQVGIPMLLLKGAAVKAVYDTAASRCLVDVDFAVPKQHLQDTVKWAEQQGYRIDNQTYHSVDMKQPGPTDGKIDIHYRLFKTSHSRSIEDEWADGAKQIQAFGVNVWVSSPENLFVQLLENELFNLCAMTENRRRFKWIYDCGKVLESTPTFDWSRVAAQAKRYSIHDAIRSMLILLAEHLPQYVPESIFSQHFSKESPERNLYVDAVLKWSAQGARRAQLNGEGKKWKSLFLRPFQMATEYRFLQMEGTVSSFREFILLHSRVKSYSEILPWVFGKLRTWKRGYVKK